MKLLASGTIDVHVVSYKRQTQRQRHRAYGSSQTRVGGEMLKAFRDARGRVPTFPFVKVPYGLAIFVTLPPTKKGRLSETAGDLDSFVKAIVDAGVDSGVFSDDNPRWFRGIVPLSDGRPTALILGDSWLVEWEIVEWDDSARWEMTT